MKRCAWPLAFLGLISILAGAQTTASVSSPDTSSQGSSHDASATDRMFFPRDMFWGWAQLDLAPPHNEIDPNSAPEMPGSTAESTRLAACLPATCCRECWKFVRLAGDSCGDSWCTERPRSCSARLCRRHSIPGLPMQSGSSTPGERRLHRQGIRVSRDAALPVRSAGRARYKPGRCRSWQQRPLGTIHDGGSA